MLQLPLLLFDVLQLLGFLGPFNDFVQQLPIWLKLIEQIRRLGQIRELALLFGFSVFAAVLLDRALAALFGLLSTVLASLHFLLDCSGPGWLVVLSRFVYSDQSV